MLTESPESILKKYWNYDAFRSGQRDIIQSILDGNDTLALLPTGGGKSICFQVPALLLGGMTLVVSPLIALMKDQVDGLKSKGISAAFIHGGLSWQDIRQLLENAVQGHYQLLYVSPERLTSPSFEGYLANLPLTLLVIDEAHCISMWGKDFRPSFLKISACRKSIPKVPVCAFTASAPTWIQDDIVSGLSLKNVKIHQGEFQRSNLQFYAIKTENSRQRIISSLQKTTGCAIVFCSTRREVQEVAQLLSQHNVPCHFYHGGLDTDTRTKRQNDWISGKVRVMVCTNAFGMGVDKADVRLVYHVSPSATAEDYYQEAGRAGRDGKESQCVMYFQDFDWQRMQENIEKQHPSKKMCEKVYHAVFNHLGVAPGEGEFQQHPINLAIVSELTGFSANDLYFSLKALDSMGQLELSEGVKSPSKIQFICDERSVRDFKDRFPELEDTVDMFLRSFGGIFDVPIMFQESVISRRLRLDENELVNQLNFMQKVKLIRYQQRSNLPTVMLLEERSQYPSLNYEVVQELKHRRLESLKKMRDYAESTTCRAQFWISHFTNADSKACGNCDNCRKKIREKTGENHKSNLRNWLKTPILLEELALNFPQSDKEIYFALLNHWLDLGHVIKTDDNLLFLKS